MKRRLLEGKQISVQITNPSEPGIQFLNALREGYRLKEFVSSIPEKAVSRCQAIERGGGVIIRE